MKYQGSCHRGKVAFDVEGTIDGALSCNCSICSRNGLLLWFVPRANLTLRTPQGAANTYTFNKHIIKHRFCSTCGVEPYADGVGPDGNSVAAVNLRCIDGLDLSAIPVREYDCRSA
jgi:hypothetical protein